jgi:hypothetical protein
MINSEYPAEFYALPFEEVLYMLIKMKKEQALAIKKEGKKSSLVGNVIMNRPFVA